jgi:hypothetical protein
MTQTPFMEYHDKVPRPSEHMQFGNNVIAPTQETDIDCFRNAVADKRLFLALMAIGEKVRVLSG